MRTIRLLGLCSLCAAALLAQTDRGVITGTVKDTSGAVVRNAQITATELSTNAAYKTKATTSGDFTVPSLPVVVNGAVRSPFELAATTAEVSTAGQFRVGGGRGGAYGMTFDGTAVTTAGQLDSNGVTFISKSGTNEFHGNFYEFLRNQKFDARGFFGATKAVYKQKDFGFTVGGPFVIPKVYHGRDKTFFFVSYEGFRNRVGATVAQSLRPFPQYSAVDTINGQGDRIGHSTYHSMQVKFSKRYSAGLTVQASYVLSKLLTDADSGGGTPEDHYNRSLEKSIASYDQTHVVKLKYVYELPFGKGRRFVTRGVGAAILGGWRFSGIQSYSSGTPFGLATTVSFPIFNGGNRPTVATYDGWRGAIAGSKFDPAVDKFLQPVSFFGAQPTDRLGSDTRYNPKLRNWPGFGERVSLARSIHFKERVRLDIRGEALNLFNRTSFGSLGGGGTLQNANFGLWRAGECRPPAATLG